MISNLSAKPWFVAAALLACSAIITLQRVHTYAEPLDRDITFYAVMGHEMLNGRQLYSDLWDNKPPLTFAVYAAAEKAAGYGPRAIFVMNVLVALLSMFGFYWVGSRIGGRASGLLGALYWSIVGADLNLEANQPNTEVFLNCSLVFCFGLMITLGKAGFKSWRAWLAGALAAISMLFKPVTLLPVLLIWGARFMAIRRDPESRAPFYRETAAIATAAALVWILVILYFQLSHRLADFVQAVFLFNRFFASQNGSLVGHLFMSPATLGKLWEYGLFWPMMPLFIFTGIGLKLDWGGVNRSLWLMLSGYLAGAYAAAAAPGFYLNHYFQLMLPPLVIGAAWSISPIKEWAARREIRLSISRWWFLAMVLIIIEGPFFRLSAQEWSRQKFGGGEFIVTQRVAARILQELRPGEQFYNWGWETGLYFYTQTRPPAGVLFSNVLQGGPLAESLTRRTLNQLHDHPPKLVVFAKWIDTGSLWQHPISRWILENYRTIPTDKQQEPFLFMVRQDPNNKPRKS